MVYIIGYILIYRITLLREQEHADGDTELARSACVCLPVEEKPHIKRLQLTKISLSVFQI
jgi:hypothetical protein